MMIRGLPASNGISIGPAFQLQTKEQEVRREFVKGPTEEWDRFQASHRETHKQLEAIQLKTAAEIGKESAAIFEAQILMLVDPEFLGSIQKEIQENFINAEAAVFEVASAYAKTLESLDSEYFQARAADVRDVSGRLIRNLSGIQASPAENLSTPSIILAEDLVPSDTVTLNKEFVLGFCTVKGGVTSHVAILSKELDIPACVGMGPEILAITDGTDLILDGGRGELHIHPNESILSFYTAERKKLEAIFSSARVNAEQEARTLDGRRIHVVANISNLDGAVTAVKYGAEGVGLFRTELLYLDHTELPDEETQFGLYRSILQTFGKKPVILRTLDIGGDKDLPYLKLAKENNSFLGLRAIRLGFTRPDLLYPQLRAAIRATIEGNLKIMIPMISSLEEVLCIRKIINECREQLEKEGYPVSQHIEVGIMVETPSAAIISDQLAKEVDFFSIGTNDLTQYTMAADRTNAAVASLANGYQPAVLRLIAQTAASGHRAGIPVGLCGGLAGEPLAIPLLIGMGIDELSMNATAIPVAKKLIRSLSHSDMQELSEEALSLTCPEEIQDLVKKRVPALAEQS